MTGGMGTWVGEGLVLVEEAQLQRQGVGIVEVEMSEIVR